MARSRLYIGNLPWTATQEDVKNFFAAVSPSFVKLVMEKENPTRSRGFAFIETDASEEEVIEQFNGQDFGGRSLVVNVANERKRAG